MPSKSEAQSTARARNPDSVEQCVIFWQISADFLQKSIKAQWHYTFLTLSSVSRLLTNVTYLLIKTRKPSKTWENMSQCQPAAAASPLPASRICRLVFLTSGEIEWKFHRLCEHWTCWTRRPLFPRPGISEIQHRNIPPSCSRRKKGYNKHYFSNKTKKYTQIYMNKV